MCSHPSIDVNTQDTDGHTALSWAVFNGHVEVVTLLLQNPDVRTDIADIDGMTPLSWAIAKRQPIILVLLLERLGIYPNPEFFDNLLRDPLEAEPSSLLLEAIEGRPVQGYYHPLQSHPGCSGKEATRILWTNPLVSETFARRKTTLQQTDFELAPHLFPQYSYDLAQTESPALLQRQML